MAITDILPPAAEPVTLDYVKTFLRVDHSESDDVIEGFMRAARLHIEDRLRTTLIERIRRFTSANFAGSCLRLDDFPIKSLNAIRLIDEDGTGVDVPLDDFQLRVSAQPAQLSLGQGGSWAAYINGASSIEVDYRAGYGPSEADVPMPLRQAILLLTGHFYQYRGDATTPSYPFMLDALLMPYQRVRL